MRTRGQLEVCAYAAGLVGSGMFFMYVQFRVVSSRLRRHNITQRPVAGRKNAAVASAQTTCHLGTRWASWATHIPVADGERKRRLGRRAFCSRRLTLPPRAAVKGAGQASGATGTDPRAIDTGAAARAAARALASGPKAAALAEQTGPLHLRDQFGSVGKEKIISGSASLLSAPRASGYVCIVPA